MWLLWLIWPTAAIAFLTGCCFLGTHVHQYSAGKDEPAVLPREPRDKNRPRLHDVADLDDPADPRLSVCPVCGMDGDEVSLDGRFCDAWPAHALCVEWLGTWKPAPGTAAVRRRPQPVPQKRTGTPEEAGVDTAQVDAFTAATAALTGAIAAVFGVPPAHLGPEPAKPAYSPDWGTRSYWIEETKQALAELNRWCICGAKFSGTAIETGALLHQHIHSGTCPMHKHPSR